MFESDFRSDTFTLPDAGMRGAIAKAEVGNAGFGEDPSVNRLEATMAEFFGRDAAVFMPSATMAGQAAIRAWCRPGDTVIIDTFGHSYFFETGAMASLSGVQAQLVPGRRGVMTAGQIEAVIKHPENEYARTGLIIIENPSNWGGGTLYSADGAAAIFALGASHGVPVHVDGARIWNLLAAEPELSPAASFAEGGSLSVCFSKGLGAPMGAALIGDADFIFEARRAQRQFGGVMRQVGFMAEAALYAFENNRGRLPEDHANAAWLAAAIDEIPGLSVDLPAVQTNMVWVEVAAGAERAAALIAALAEHGIGAFSLGERLRFVTSRLVGSADCRRAASSLQALMRA
ncbi:MAG: aminotransferase class I/II-fold pyridoxal phosphate-dependent enzyme [Gammaproteobacteria bacterium]|nr:aminotransferase class I/II-fold pyridoxal phosphate-dependent enzyme [Gammaproteobacteria bacterium]